MTLVAQNSIDDLNMGESITVNYSTGGKQKYWQGRMVYKIDNKFPETKITQIMIFDANGNFIKSV